MIESLLDLGGRQELFRGRLERAAPDASRKGGTILTSVDGVNYTTGNAGVTNDLHGVTWGAGLWIAVGEPGVVLTSAGVLIRT